MITDYQNTVPIIFWAMYIYLCVYTLYLNLIAKLKKIDAY